MNNKSTLILSAVIILAIGLAGGFLIARELDNGHPDPADNAIIDHPDANTGDSTGNNSGDSNQTAGWETFTDSTQGVSFQYPRGLETTYVTAVDWPPQPQVLDENFTCTEAGSETQQAGKTEQITTNGRTYCVTKISEGAAGSVYIQHAYSFVKEGQVVILTFSLRYPQCANYDDPQKTACETEQADFDVAQLVDAIAQTLRLS